MHRRFSETEPELMDLPDVSEQTLKADLRNLAFLNRFFGAHQAVLRVFRTLRHGLSKLTLVDLAAGYGDHGRNLIQRAAAEGCDLTIIAVDHQMATLRIARAATSPEHPMFFVQADAHHLPFRKESVDLTFCSLALHHFSEKSAVRILEEMRRISSRGTACVDLVRSRLGVLGIWLLTTFILREPITRHDARVSIRRAFTHRELCALAKQARWSGLRHLGFFWFQQAVLAPRPLSSKPLPEQARALTSAVEPFLSLSE